MVFPLEIVRCKLGEQHALSLQRRCRSVEGFISMRAYFLTDQSASDIRVCDVILIAIDPPRSYHLTFDLVNRHQIPNFCL